ncbi:MAG: helix-turn-helix transcriptional regulator [Vicinamibacteria bacterium]
MWATTELLRFAAAVVAVLLGAVVLRDHRRNATAVASAALLAGVAAHLLLLPLLRHGAWQPVVHTVLLLSLTVPVAFWLLAHLHFDDDFRFRRRHAWAVAAFVAVGYVSWLAAVESAQSDRFWVLLPRLLGLVVVLHALLRVYVGAGADLVLPRLRARFAVLVVSGSYVLLELLGEVLFSGSASEATAEAAHAVAVLGLIMGVAFVSLRTASDVLRLPEAALDGPALDADLAERLRRLVEIDEVFREEGLTIGSLAERLGAQEHKLRQLINAQLGFKNFNAFLNRFRIRAAEKQLADPTKAHLGVAEVAYQVGYRSLATFNRAFKEVTGRTPTEHRAALRQ